MEDAPQPLDLDKVGSWLQDRCNAVVWHVGKAKLKLMILLAYVLMIGLDAHYLEASDTFLRWYYGFVCVTCLPCFMLLTDAHIIEMGRYCKLACWVGLGLNLLFLLGTPFIDGFDAVPIRLFKTVRCALPLSIFYVAAAPATPPVPPLPTAILVSKP